MSVIFQCRKQQDTLHTLINQPLQLLILLKLWKKVKLFFQSAIKFVKKNAFFYIYIFAPVFCCFLASSGFILSVINSGNRSKINFEFLSSAFGLVRAVLHRSFSYKSICVGKRFKKFITPTFQSQFNSIFHHEHQFVHVLTLCYRFRHFFALSY